MLYYIKSIKRKYIDSRKDPKNEQSIAVSH